MKHSVIPFLCILYAASLLSCKIETEAPEGFVDAVFTASFDKSSQEFYSEDGSKTYRDGTHTLWSASDQIKIFYSNSTSSTFTLQSGTGTASGQFAGLSPAGKTANYAVYPAGATATRSSNTVVNVTVPENQNGTFASCNYAVSCIHSGNELYFSNITSLMCIQLTSGDVRTVVVESVDGSALRGTLPITCSSGTVSVGSATSPGSSITVSTSGTGKRYISILSGVTHAKGLKFTFKNGSKAIIGTYYLNKSITTAGDKVYNFGDFEPTKAYYVTVSGAGNGNGLSWTNAMSKDTMFGMLSRSAAGSDSAKEAALFDAIDGATFYMGAGTYNFGSTPLIDIDEESTITFKLEGGYNASTGARNISGNKTYITGARAGTSGAYTGHHCLDLSGNMNVTLDGLYLVDGYVHGSNSPEGALTFSGSSLNVTMTDCEVSNHLNDTDGGTDSGAAIFMSAAGGLTATRVTFTGNESHCAPALFGNSTSMTFNNCTFTSNRARSWGGAARLNAGNSGYSIIFNTCTFSSNSAAGDSGCFVQSNGTLTFNSCSFTGNSCTGNGGALTLLGSASPVNINGCTFSGNSSNKGGAIWSGNNNTKTVTIGKYSSTATTFTNNDADAAGGAIYAESKGAINITEALFTGNHVNNADGEGGAIALRISADESTDQTLSLSGCTFGGSSTGQPNYSDMDGGALSLKVGTTTITNCSFIGNEALNDDETRTSGDGYGGAIDCYGSANLSISGGAFSGNKAWRGGAINCSSSGTVEFSGVTFTANGGSNARNGGAIRANANMDFTNCTFGGDTDAMGNTAFIGGAIYIESQTTTIDGCVFSRNVARTTEENFGGGAIFMATHSTKSVNLTVKGTSKRSEFNYNSTSSCGGAISGWHETYDKQSNALTIQDSCLFVGNHASKWAGAILFKNKGSMTVTDSRFTGNYSAEDSGAFNGDNANTSFTFNGVKFSGNHAEGNHGGVMWIAAGTYSFTGCTFSENYLTVANKLGGAVYMHGTTAPYEFTNCSFTGNYSSGGFGGAMAIDVAGTISIKGGSFNGNHAKTGGAILTKNNGSLTIAKNGSSRTLFTRNYTQTNGNYGGAIRIESQNATFSCTGTDFTYNEIKMNSEGNAFGGAISIGQDQNGVHADITDCTFSNNSTTYGGATALSYQSAAGKGDGTGYMRVSDCSFTNNVTNYSGSNNTNYGRHGGAVRLGHDATPSYFDNCTFVGNGTKKAGSQNISTNGGAITFYADGMCYISNCYFEGNYATRGGAISSWGCTASGLYLNACSFSGNYCSFKNGTAIYVARTKKFCMNNCSFNDNTYTTLASANDIGAWVYVDGNRATNDTSGASDDDTSYLEECVVSNCTLIGTSKSPNASTTMTNDQQLLYIMDVKSGSTCYLINNLIIDRGNSQHYGWWTTRADNKSFNNVYSKVGNSGGGSATPSNDTSGKTYANIGSPSWNSTTHVWPWNGGGITYTKISASTFETQVGNGSSDFKTWLKTTLGVLTKDALGNDRGSSNWRPGAYQN